MTQAYLVKTANGYLPATDNDFEALRRVKLGGLVRVQAKFPRNYENHKRYFAFIDAIFAMQDHFADPEIMRKWLEMRAGHFDTIVQPNGNTLFIPKSIAFDKMPENEFRALFDKCISVAVEQLELDENAIMQALEFV